MSRPLSTACLALAALLSGCASTVNCTIENRTSAAVRAGLIADSSKESDEPRMYAEAVVAPGARWVFEMKLDSGPSRLALFVFENGASFTQAATLRRGDAKTIIVERDGDELRIVDVSRATN